MAEAFLNNGGRALGRTTEEHPLLVALRNAPDPAMLGTSLLPLKELPDGLPEDLSE